MEGALFSKFKDTYLIYLFPHHLRWGCTKNKKFQAARQEHPIP